MSTTINPLLIDLPMPILTPRLRIQPRHFGEGKILHKAVQENVEHLKPWMPWVQANSTLEESEIHCREKYIEFLSRKDITLSVYSRDGKTFIGSAGFHHLKWDLRSFMIGYWVHKDFEGKGFVTETANALTRYGFDVLKARRIHISCDSTNERSLAVMKRLGYHIEGTLRSDALDVNGQARDTIITSRISADGLPALEVSLGA